MRLLLFSIMTVAMIGLMVPSAFAESIQFKPGAVYNYDEPKTIWLKIVGKYSNEDYYDKLYHLQNKSMFCLIFEAPYLYHLQSHLI